VPACRLFDIVQANDFRLNHLSDRCRRTGADPSVSINAWARLGSTPKSKEALE